MSAHTRWALVSYGPAAVFTVIGVVGFILTGELWTLAYAGAGGALGVQVRSSIYLYRSAYFRGRGEQLRDLSDGTWPDPRTMEPNPWDSY